MVFKMGRFNYIRAAARLKANGIASPVLAVIPISLVCFGLVLFGGISADAKPRQPQNSPTEADPAYWGLKKGAYIPSKPGCWGGTWGYKQFDYEICAAITYCEEGKPCPKV